MHEPPASWPAGDQSIRLDPTTASIEVASATGIASVDVPTTIGVKALEAVDLSRPTPSP